ncbi:LysR family transcriptional regulator [Roseovarius sp. THAF8]|uniref:LysR family transcriptional regulator n=1 Tax=Roseovarius sp. THAF8 TaxID=2587846 RepID=UPI0012686E99|nr:LysR family transcriptional regulator [Roseovarius sp. THAF8]
MYFEGYVMNHKSLLAFRAFMEGGSVNDAAERLHRTQPQVSRLLSILEDEVGFTLFVRKGRRLNPTREARELYSPVERALSSLDEIENEARRIKAHQRSHVRILTAPHVTNALVAEAIATITEEDPQFTATIDSRTRIDIDIWLGREQFDVGISVLPLDDSSMDIEPMASVDAVAVMHEDHPLAAQDEVSLEDLIDEPLVINSPRTVMRQRIDALFRRKGASPNIRLETPNGVVACELAARGLGVSVSDGFVARSSIRPNMVIRPFVPKLTLEYVIFFPRWRTRTPAINRLAELILLSAKRVNEGAQP